MDNNNNSRSCGCNYLYSSQKRIRLGNGGVRQDTDEQILPQPFCKIISPSPHRASIAWKARPAVFHIITSNFFGVSERIRLGEPAVVSSWRVTAAKKQVTKLPSKTKSDPREQKKAGRERVERLI